MQVNCQTKKFTPLLTRNQGGYNFIVGDLASILKNTQRFKPLNNEDLKAEKRIVVTTMKE